jgi:hypothetical protein
VCSLVDNGRKLDALKASDFAFFAATWWPKAGYTELEVLLFLAIWLFTWDDEVDEPTGAYSMDLASAEQYRTQTIDSIHRCLSMHFASLTEDVPTNKTIASFSDIGGQLAKVYSLGTRREKPAQGKSG